ncbi:hypothetical protein TPY_3133 [Sulfobacillus acidophilus TPY]|uniref:Uncharacterized protein n=1 Tax=Sulfobacillus acidophilus (strain ATCC 700253 / DSM 10332 / NAL) TaxID=679936 RepID=G8TZZ8_SULAD|nr:hypothetical protein TPY_3133 [Sulfobacillus acidophilus TPY]AEW04167.1 hypothetical protein Sulac_0654 [Sulfobacillus acidophilus DSM 10332]
MTYRDVMDVYTPKTRPAPPVVTPHPKQVRRRRAFQVPVDAADPQAPDLLRVVIRP